MKPFVITSILAPTDLSESNGPALRYARLIADRFSARVMVVPREAVPVSSRAEVESELMAGATS